MVRCAVALTVVMRSRYLEIRIDGAVLRVIDIQDKAAVDTFDGWERDSARNAGYLLVSCSEMVNCMLEAYLVFATRTSKSP